MDVKAMLVVGALCLLVWAIVTQAVAESSEAPGWTLKALAVGLGVAATIVGILAAGWPS